MLLILWIITICICFSQTNNDTLTVSLQPDSVLTDSMGLPTHFAWRVSDQVPLIAEHVIRSKASRDIEVNQDSSIIRCDSIIDYQSLLIRTQKYQINNRQEVIATKENIISETEDEVKKWKIRAISWPSGISGGFILLLMILI